MTWDDHVRIALVHEMETSPLSEREVASILGHTHTWLGKRLRGQCKITLGDIEAIGTVIGISPRKFIASVMEDGTRATHVNYILVKQGPKK